MKTPSLPPLAQWTPDELEWLNACPICGSARATVLHEGLKDYAFSAAGGQWRLMACEECTCAYLNPRPTPSTIGRAYGTYYTHGGSSATNPMIGARAWLRRALANGYRNEVYGTRSGPSLGVAGSFLARLMPSFRNAIEGEAPGLVRVRPSRAGKSRILDVGCGSGLSLLRARDAGWCVMGIEPDEAAIKMALSRGIQIVARQLDELSSEYDGTFERIMLSHVIEHVHDPLAMLRRCRELLVPGGALWLETPNLSSVGHSSFGADWRGLEPPRHLVLFRPEALHRLLVEAGFSAISTAEPRDVWTYMFHHSHEIRRKRRADTAHSTDEGTVDGKAPIIDGSAADYVRAARGFVAMAPSRSEFITLVATG